MANSEYKDALSIEQAAITVNGETWGYISGLSVDGRSPESLQNVIGGLVRRSGPTETSWSADGVVLYGNLKTLEALKGEKFNIVLLMQNPSAEAPATNQQQTLTIENCKISEENITINDASTFRMGGIADGWTIT